MDLKSFLGTSCFVFIFLSTQVLADIQLIAKIGQTAVGFPSNFSYSELNEPQVGPEGHVVFAGKASDGGRVITRTVWAGLPGQLTAIIKENDTMTGFPSNVFFSDVLYPSTFLITSSGAVGFLARMKGASTGAALLAYVDGVTHGIIKSGDPAPGFPPGTVMGDVIEGGASFNDAGIFFIGVTSRGTGLWFWDFNKIERISVRIGECDDYHLSNFVSSNKNGSAVFYALYSGSNRSCSSAGVFKWSNGKAELLVADGDPVPDMPGVVFGIFMAAFTPIINDQDEVIFNASLIQAGYPAKGSVWVKNDLSEPKLLALDGETLQGKPTHVISVPGFFDFNFVNHGYSLVPVKANGFDGLDVLLTGKPRELQPYSSVTETGASQLTVTALKNDQPPGLEPSWFYSGFSSRAINNAEQYVFSGIASNALESRTISAIWRGDGDSYPRLVAKEGMKLSVNDIEYVLDKIYFPVKVGTYSTIGGKSSWLSDNGDIVFRGLLDKSSSLAIFLITDDSKEQKIFNLAEQLFPRYFSPANVDDQLLEGFVYRYYPDTKTYIGIKNGEVFVLGDVFGSGPQRIDTIENTLQLLEGLAAGS